MVNPYQPIEDKSEPNPKLRRNDCPVCLRLVSRATLADPFQGCPYCQTKLQLSFPGWLTATWLILMAIAAALGLRWVDANPARFVDNALIAAAALVAIPLFSGVALMLAFGRPVANNGLRPLSGLEIAERRQAYIAKSAATTIDHTHAS